MKFPKDSVYHNMLLKKVAPPLITLLSGARDAVHCPEDCRPEMQYIALRTISLIVQRRPEILKQETKVFSVTYNDPSSLTSSLN